MELKKNPKYDLIRKEGTFRNLGLTISLLLVILVFEWPSRAEETIIDLGQVSTEEVEIADIPITEQPPPPPPKMTQVFDVVEVPDEEEIEEEIDIELDVEVTEITSVADVVFDPGEEVMEEEVEEVFLIVEDAPEFPGGIEAFYAHMAANIRYPAAALRLNVQGRVYVQFTVEKDGSLTDIHVVKGIGAGCDEEAVRVMKTVPNFIPGKQRGVPVRVKRVMPIYFKLVNKGSI